MCSFLPQIAHQNAFVGRAVRAGASISPTTKALFPQLPPFPSLPIPHLPLPSPLPP